MAYGRHLLGAAAALLASLASTSCFAGDLSTVINGKSFHIGSEKSWNEANYGLGFEYQVDTNSRWKPVLMANGFRDSERNMSYMVGGGLHRTVWQSQQLGGLHLDLGLNAFLMTREDVDDGRPFPGLLPSLTVGNRVMGFNVGYLPRSAVQSVANPRTMDRDLKGVAFVQLKINVSELLRKD